MPTYVWKCQQCEQEIDWQTSIANRDIKPDVDCEYCQAHAWERLMQAPIVLSASFLDGTKRAGFAELKEASKLESKLLNLPPDKRGEAAKELAKLKSSKK